ncbi:MAG: hypothetical protein OXC82_11585 [Rhodobacteraceae bacterium]|nr:hypothetical protein [Paracoccaceae bacterium]MCY4251059.1 hypothetical protein [Paracoccaceae bacterium]MCY4308545.1 hypothetical protein [Paracoccaceae bacterium]
MKRFPLIGIMVAMLVGCSEPKPESKGIREHLCEENQGQQIKRSPQVRQTGTAELGINSHGEIIRSVAINFETSTNLGRDRLQPSNNTLAPCRNDN